MLARAEISVLPNSGCEAEVRRILMSDGLICVPSCENGVKHSGWTYKYFA
jgi:hypothetical protein